MFFYLKTLTVYGVVNCRRMGLNSERRGYRWQTQFSMMKTVRSTHRQSSMSLVVQHFKKTTQINVIWTQINDIWCPLVRLGCVDMSVECFPQYGMGAVVAGCFFLMASLWILAGIKLHFSRVRLHSH